jgi:chromosome segregation ATPase
LASAEARERLVTLAGSASNLTSWASTYAQNYLTEQEKLAPVKKAVDEAMSSLGLASVTTRDEFKRVVASLDLTTEAGAKQFTSMMQLADAFAQVHAATEVLTRTESDIASERANLQDQLDQLTMTSTQLLKKQRDALAEANRPLFDMVQAAQKLADTSSSLTTFRDSVRSLSDSLSTGSLSVLTPEQQEAELKSQYEKIRAAAMGGDTTAQSKFSDALTAWLTASQKLNAGDTTYQADFAQGQKDASAAAAWATGQIDSAQAQLNEMNSQTLALKGMQNTLDAANKILDTIAQNTGPAPIQSGFVLSNAISVMGTVLGTAIKAVQSEVASLRKDQDAQTGGQITANAEGQQAIVDGLNKMAAKATITKVEQVALE